MFNSKVYREGPGQIYREGMQRNKRYELANRISGRNAKMLDFTGISILTENKFQLQQRRVRNGPDRSPRDIDNLASVPQPLQIPPFDSIRFNSICSLRLPYAVARGCWPCHGFQLETVEYQVKRVFPFSNTATNYGNN